ncbi:MAG TPA: hypothetical protein VIJ39_15920 [Solirubrobacteraceae bacterium]
MTLVVLFAMTGGAYAASKYVITSTKQISPRVLKSLVGKTGAQGVSGKEGTPGKEGALGKEGATGKEGTAGKEGKEGPQGPQGETGAVGPKGETGAAGPAGPAGKNGTGGGFGKTLPSGETETGTWTSQRFREEGVGFSPISFSIPLASPLGSSEVHIVTLEEQKKENGAQPPTECLGTVDEPKASKGTLCVYEGEADIEAPTTSKILVAQVCPPSEMYAVCQNGAAKAGAILLMDFQNNGKIEEEGVIQGSWAVTAP